MATITNTSLSEMHGQIAFPIDSMSSDEIESVISLLRAELILRKSKLTQEDADEISEEIKRNWWNQNKYRILKMIGENE